MELDQDTNISGRLLDLARRRGAKELDVIRRASASESFDSHISMPIQIRSVAREIDSLAELSSGDTLRPPEVLANHILLIDAVLRIAAQEGLMVSDEVSV